MCNLVACLLQFVHLLDMTQEQVTVHLYCNEYIRHMKSERAFLSNEQSGVWNK